MAKRRRSGAEAVRDGGGVRAGAGGSGGAGGRGGAGGDNAAVAGVSSLLGSAKELASAPLKALPAAIRAVPAVKYALGVLGVAGCVAVAMSYFHSPQTGLVAMIVGFALMGLLVVFAKAAVAKGAHQLPAEIFVWVCLILFVVWAVGLTTSVFVGVPLRISIFSPSEAHGAPPSSSSTPTPAPPAPALPKVEPKVEPPVAHPATLLEIVSASSTKDGVVDMVLRNPGDLPIVVTSVEGAVVKTLGATSMPDIPVDLKFVLTFTSTAPGSRATKPLKWEAPPKKLTRFNILVRIATAARIELKLHYDQDQVATTTVDLRY